MEAVNQPQSDCKLHALTPEDAAALASAVGSVFEAVDTTNEETYWTLGVWPTLEAALGAMTECSDDPPFGDNGDCDDSDAHVVEVRERKVGWSGTGKAVEKLEWRRIYKEAEDEYQWHRIPNDRSQRTG